jgi:hypothetical protein
VKSQSVFPSKDWRLYVQLKAWADAVVLLLQLLIAASTVSAGEDEVSKGEDSPLLHHTRYIA